MIAATLCLLFSLQQRCDFAVFTATLLQSTTFIITCGFSGIACFNERLLAATLLQSTTFIILLTPFVFKCFTYIYTVSYTHLDVYKRQIVTMELRASGIAATASAMANMKASPIGSPLNTLIPKSMPQNTSMSMDS